MSCSLVKSLRLRPAANCSTVQNATCSSLSGSNLGNSSASSCLAFQVPLSCPWVCSAFGWRLFGRWPKRVVGSTKAAGRKTLAIGVFSSIDAVRRAWIDLAFAVSRLAISSQCESVNSTRDCQEAWRTISEVISDISPWDAVSWASRSIGKETPRAWAWCIEATMPLARMLLMIHSRRPMGSWKRVDGLDFILAALWLSLGL